MNLSIYKEGRSKKVWSSNFVNLPKIHLVFWIFLENSKHKIICGHLMLLSSSNTQLRKSFIVLKENFLKFQKIKNNVTLKYLKLSFEIHQIPNNRWPIQQNKINFNISSMLINETLIEFFWKTPPKT